MNAISYSSSWIWARVIRRLDRIPYALIALIARAATCSVFLRSGLQKLSDWNSTLLLFQNECRVPVLPPHVAAYLAASLELGCSALILIGLLTRVSVAALLGLVLYSCIRVPGPTTSSGWHSCSSCWPVVQDPFPLTPCCTSVSHRRALAPRRLTHRRLDMVSKIDVCNIS